MRMKSKSAGGAAALLPTSSRQAAVRCWVGFMIEDPGSECLSNDTRIQLRLRPAARAWRRNRAAGGHRSLAAAATGTRGKRQPPPGASVANPHSLVRERRAPVGGHLACSPADEYRKVAHTRRMATRR